MAGDLDDSPQIARRYEISGLWVELILEALYADQDRELVLTSDESWTNLIKLTLNRKDESNEFIEHNFNWILYYIILF